MCLLSDSWASVLDKISWVRLHVSVKHCCSSISTRNWVESPSLSIHKRRKSFLVPAYRVVRRDARQYKADKHLEGAAFPVSITMHVSWVVSKEVAYTVHAICASYKRHVKALRTLINGSWVHVLVLNIGPIEHQLNQLRWLLVPIFVKLSLELI